MVRMDVADPARLAPLRIVVVDADDLVRESLARLLGIGDRIEVVGSAGRADLAIELIAAAQPDVIVVDPRMPELARGIAFIERARSVAPGASVLALGSADVVEQAALNDCVDRCLIKTFRPADLTAAILVAGRRALD
jgi:DNA-binding NarL/FixJ family response regulator